MTKAALATLLLIGLTPCPRPASAGTAPFSCAIREAHAFLPQLQTFSGYRWIECVVVGVETVQIDGVSINNGACEAFDWYSGRTFSLGQIVNIPYACMSPVTLAIAANGATSRIRLK